MSWYPINYFLGSIFSLLSGLFVIYRGESKRSTQCTWFFLCFATSIWFMGRFLMSIAETEQLAEKAILVVYSGAIFSPVFFLHFVSSLLNEEKETWPLQLIYYVLSALWIPTLFAGYLANEVERLPNIGFYEVPGPIYLGFFFYFAAAPTISVFKLIRACTATQLPNKKNQLKYVVYASLLGYAGGASSFLPFVSTSIPPIGASISYFYTFIIAYAIARYRLMDINIAIKRSLIYALLLLLLLVPCFALVVWGQVAAFGTTNFTFSLSTLLLFIIVGFLFPKLRFRTEEALERVLFTKRVDHRDTLLRSSRDMVSIVNIKALSDNLVRTIGKSLGIEKVSLLLNDDSKASYSLEASVGLEIDEPDRVQLPREGPLVQLLQRRREPIVKEELEWVPVGPQTPQTVEAMRKMGAEISLPIVSKEKLIGILNLGHKDDKTIYSNEDLELLSTLANQAAIAIENARLYENLKQSQDTLRRADRLSSLGLLTAGLAHEIRNPLVAIRTFTQLLPERYNDAEFREGFQGLALKEVDRICGLINDLLSFARPSKPNVALENVNDVVDNIARILEAQAKEKGMSISREFSDSLPKVWIDREQMKQVFMNLILNAIQAMKEGGSIILATRAVSRNGSEPSGEFVQVEIRDTGIGIPEESLQHIFDPFFTSKDEGSGLGLAVSHQIVQEHGGFVTVESNLGKGTAFFVHVPVGKQVRAATNPRTQVNEANLSH
jgi:two-component system NtrC family sensor kinase